MIGYHFTILRNWPSIQEQGLQPYRLNKPPIDIDFADPYGIFIFPDDCVDDLDRIGCIYYQAVNKKDFGVVELEVEYDESDLKPFNAAIARTVDKHGDIYSITHTGTLGYTWTYHVRPLLVLSGPIRPERIRLRATYDIRDVLISAPMRIPAKEPV